MKNTARSSALTRGVIIFALLAVLTVVEYFLGIYHVPQILLWIVALLKGGLVLWFFMHVGRVFLPDGDHE